MPTISQPKNLGDLLKYEAPNLYSRDQDTVAAAQNLSLGTVVGRETATAKLKALAERFGRHGNRRRRARQ